MKKLAISTCFSICLTGVSLRNLKSCHRLHFVLLRNFSTKTPATKNDLPKFNLCLFGDSRHGKTSLASAITLHQSRKNLAVFKETIDIDNAVEEIDRGHSINPSKMVFSTEKRKYVLTDCPGLPVYQKNTAIASCGSDAAVIVVSGSEGPTKVTRSHLIIAKYQGIKDIVGFINKSDLADEEDLGIAELATKEMLEEEGFNVNNVQFVYGSAKNYLTKPDDSQHHQSLEYLIRAIDELPSVERITNSSGLMFVDRIYNPPKRAVGVTGVILRGIFSKGDKIDLVGYDKLIRTSILSMESFGKVQDKSLVGDSVEILLKSVKKSELSKGMALIPKDSQLNLPDRVEIMLKMLPNHDEDRFILFNKEKRQVLSKTGEIHCNIYLKDREFTLSGESALAELRLVKGFHFEEKQAILFREEKRLFAIGEVTKVLPQMTVSERKELLRAQTFAQKEEFTAFKKKILEEYGIKTYS